MIIKNAVFDVGNVLVRWDPDQVIRDVLGDTPFHHAYKNALIECDLWLQLDRGSVSPEEAVAQLAPQFPDINQQRDLFAILFGYAHHLPPIPGSFELFHSLKDAGYGMYILSNFQDYGFRLFEQTHPVLQTSGTVVSARVQMMKPEPDIYQYLLQTYHLVPNETVFIDDRPENITAAIEAGIHGIVFENPDQCVTALTALGITGLVKEP